jgi:hypothetical protein
MKTTCLNTSLLPATFIAVCPFSLIRHGICDQKPFSHSIVGESKADEEEGEGDAFCAIIIIVVVLVDFALMMKAALAAAALSF